MPDDLLLLYVPVPPDQAEGIARRLIESRLVACANIFPGVHAIYPWHGEIETARESLLILKTLTRLADEAERLLVAEHPNDIPCILRLTPNGVNASYAEWIRRSVRPS